MVWFRKPRYTTVGVLKKKDIPDGLWTKCEDCGEIIYNKELMENLKVCPRCNFHFRLTAVKRIEMLTDPNSFQEMDAGLEPGNPLEFEDVRPYEERLREAQEKTGLREAAVTGEARIEGVGIVIGVLEFDFIGGSMSSVVGEKISRAADRAREAGLPLVTVSSSGGARMQEGVLSLMQMSKTAAAVGLLGEAGVPHVSVLANPTSGGVTASFASLGDVILAEPKALICFAGPRVIRQTIQQELPPGFQRAEFVFEHGMLDRVVPRRELRDTVARVVRLLTV